jgi:methanol metabolism-related c-type cytochrome
MRSAAPLLAFAMLVAGGAYAQEAPSAEPKKDAAPGAATDAADAGDDSAAIADTAAAETDGIRWYNAEGVPTYKIAEDGTVDWPTFSGFRRYHAECHVCHGPDGEGSTYAPALKNSVMRVDYYDFVGTVASGRQVVNAADNQVMPAFGTNPNVMCYLDDIYTYLRARGTDAVPRGRPAKREDKSDEYAEAEKACMEQ